MDTDMTGERMEKIYHNICRGNERRANLISLKKELKDEDNRAIFRRITGNCMDEIMKCLVDEDAKVRKNAAAILGIMHCQEAMDVLMDAYQEEEQLFVKADYVKAMSELSCEDYMPDFRKRLEYLNSYDPPENEKKHIQAEIKELKALILKKDGIKKHTFRLGGRANDVILVTLPAFCPVLAGEISGKKKVLKNGVRTIVTDMEAILQIRTYSEILFVLDCDKKLPKDPVQIAEALKDSDLMEILEENHREEGPFYFRVGLAGPMPQEEKGIFSRKVSSAVEQAFSHSLINSVSHYEIEIRLIRNQDGSFYPCLKLFTLPDHRFDYRRFHIAASMKPNLAAGLIALAKPYMTEYAQVLDPFCGVGTLLIERRFQVSARNCYGIDTYGEAIEKARKNSRIAGMHMNYINRNYFDFIHDYAFDEIVTDLPSGHLTRLELDRLYGKFLEKSQQVLKAKGRIICFTREQGILKKQLRLNGGYRLLKEFCIQEKNGSWLFILEKK